MNEDIVHCELELCLDKSLWHLDTEPQPAAATAR